MISRYLQPLTFCRIFAVTLVMAGIAGCTPRTSTGGEIIAVSDPQRYLNTTYSVAERLKSDEMVSKEAVAAFDFHFCMAGPQWEAADFDLTEEEILRRYVEEFSYTGSKEKERMPAYIANIHATGGKILCCFPGAEFIRITTDPQRSAKFATMMAAFVKRFDFDGIDLDWEHTIEPDLYVGFIRRIREALDALQLTKPLYLTSALNTSVVFTPGQAEELCKHLDWINLMYYDMGGGSWGRKASHNTPLNEIRRSLATDWASFPKEKLSIGLANYGYMYRDIRPETELPEGETLERYCTGSVGYKIMPELLAKQWTSVYDTTAHCSYYFSPDQSEFITTDDPQSIDRKLEWLLEAGYNKIFWWEYSCDWVAPKRTGERGEHLLMDRVSRRLGKLK